MKNLFLLMERELAAGRSCYLCSLVANEGSTPRGSGAHMVVGCEGLLGGTIGGGAMEYAAVNKARELLRQGRAASFVEHYDLTPSAGLACGGSCTVLFTLIDAESRGALEQGLLAENNGSTYWLQLSWADASLQSKAMEIIFTANEAVKNLPSGKRQGNVRLAADTFYIEQFNYDGAVYVFGAGHVARELVPLLSQLDFRCLVLDDRAEFAQKELFPTAYKVLQVDYTKLADSISVGSRDYAVVMTRGHQYDAEAERYLLHTDAKYIGIMGSRHKAALAKAALLAEGYSQQQLARITTPIGIDINSETPAEIAVSIAAQLIKVRNKQQ